MGKVRLIKLVGLSTVVGLVGRIFIIVGAPLWYDEAYSIWAAQAPLSQILTAEIDPPHTPGYYLLLRAFMAISDHLVFLRSTTLLFFCLNIFLLYRLAKRAIGPEFAAIATIIYSLSGYFLVFDWQVRMYTPIVSLILLSQYIGLAIRQSKHRDNKSLLLLGLVDVFGLYLDYAYVWYFFPKVAVELLYVLRSRKQLGKVALTGSFSIIGFLALFPHIFARFSDGIGGIIWVEGLLSPTFFIPFFFGFFVRGDVESVILVLFLLFMLLTLMYRKHRFIIDNLVVAGISFTFTLSFSFIVKPLFHVRSLQIIGLALLFLMSNTALILFRRKPRSLHLIFAAQLSVFVFALVSTVFQVDRTLAHYLPWKNFAIQNDLDRYAVIRYVITPENTTHLYPWGLEYTLSGKESLGARAYTYAESSQEEIEKKNCVQLAESSVHVYGCTD
jgi:uncharacterized membrane protein